VIRQAIQRFRHAGAEVCTGAPAWEMKWLLPGVVRLGQFVDEVVQLLLGAFKHLNDVGRFLVFTVKNLEQVVPGDFFDLLDRFTILKQLLKACPEGGHESIGLKLEFHFETSVG